MTYLPKCTPAFFQLHWEVKVLFSYSIRVSHSEFSTTGIKVRHSLGYKLCWDQVLYFSACDGNKQPLSSADLLFPDSISYCTMSGHNPRLCTPCAAINCQQHAFTKCAQSDEQGIVQLFPKQYFLTTTKGQCFLHFY